MTVRDYGNQYTHLILTRKAQDFYSGSDIRIKEVLNGDSITYTITLDGSILEEGLNAGEVNDLLEAMQDDFLEVPLNE